MRAICNRVVTHMTKQFLHVASNCATETLFH